MRHLVIASSLALAMPALASSTIHLKLAGKYRHGQGHERTHQDFKASIACEPGQTYVVNHVVGDDEEFTTTVTPERVGSEGVRVDTVFTHRVGDEVTKFAGAVLTRLDDTAEMSFDGQGAVPQHFSLEVGAK